MNLQIFVCFHKKIFSDYYQISHSEKQKYITFYGVLDKDSEINTNVIYEYDLIDYNPILQQKKYNEASCIYHVYKNNLHNYDYIGFCQYDVTFPPDIFQNIKQKILNNTNTIFHINFFQWQFFGGQTTIIKDYHNIPAGLQSYNNFFNTNYTANDLVTNKMISNNTFIIPKKMYEKMMSWLINYFKDDIDIIYMINDGCHFNPGHMIEALTGMFLALEINEGALYEKINLFNPND